MVIYSYKMTTSVETSFNTSDSTRSQYAVGVFWSKYVHTFSISMKTSGLAMAAGASSMIFWCRRWIEQSRPNRDIALPIGKHHIRPYIDIDMDGENSAKMMEYYKVCECGGSQNVTNINKIVDNLQFYLIFVTVLYKVNP